ncbi:MAG: hypothetical protein H7A53_11650 [Akkermansiaceae bacterium]|nr:hypothetical protein [Akkermansiaceae bacterium]MCP5551534.1 hypothetical protein [Akkermansiaceae bacterium]
MAILAMFSGKGRSPENPPSNRSWRAVVPLAAGMTRLIDRRLGLSHLSIGHNRERGKGEPWHGHPGHVFGEGTFS